PAIAVTFNRGALPASMSVNTNDGLCSGSMQVSRAADNFATGTCVRMAALPAGDSTSLTFTVTPAAPLDPTTAYLVRISTSAKDSDGVPLAANFTTPAGFTT